VRWALIGVAVVVGLYGVHKLATYADRKGWIYYRTKAPAGAGSRAIMRATAVFDPTIEHVIEEVASDRLVVDESGEPPRMVVDESGEPPRIDG
jgi:hypothetical protein